MPDDAHDIKIWVSWKVKFCFHTGWCTYKVYTLRHTTRTHARTHARTHTHTHTHTHSLTHSNKYTMHTVIQREVYCKCSRSTYKENQTMIRGIYLAFFIIGFFLFVSFLLQYKYSILSFCTRKLFENQPRQTYSMITGTTQHIRHKTHWHIFPKQQLFLLCQWC